MCIHHGLAFSEPTNIFIAHFAFEVLGRIIPDDVDQSPNVELSEGLRDPHFNFVVPLFHFWRFAIIADMEQIKALFEGEQLSESLQIYEHIHYDFLIDDELSRHIAVDRQRIIDEHLFYDIVFLDNVQSLFDLRLLALGSALRHSRRVIFVSGAI